MSTENVDIVVTESGSAEAAANVAKVGDAAAAATPNLDAMKVAGLLNDDMMRNLKASAERLGITVEEQAGKVRGAAAAFSEHTEQLKEHATASEHATESTGHLTEASNLLKEALTALGLLLTADKLIHLAEEYEKIDLQLRSVSKSTEALAANQQALIAISQRTGSSYAENVSAFQKLTVETQALGISQKDLLGVISTVDTVVQRSGGTSKEAATAVSLFGRALAIGQVEGREFRTVVRDFPELAQLAAKGLNTSVSALTSFGNGSKVASQDFIKGFLQAADTAGIAGKTIELTLGGALQKLQNALLLYVGALEHSNGLTQVLANAISGLANNFGTIANVLTIALTAFTSFYGIMVVIPGAIALATTAVRSFTLALLANPLVAVIATLVTIIALIYEFGSAIKITADGSITLLGALKGAFEYVKDAITGNLSATKTLSDYMKDATQQIKDGTESTKNLGAALDDGAASAANFAGKVQLAGDGMTQLGRVIASAIPPFENLVIAQKKADEAMKAAAETMRRYTEQIKANAAAVANTEVVTRDAMGNIIKYVNEAANETGSAFNGMTQAADKTANAFTQVAEAAQAAQQAAQSANTTAQSSAFNSQADVSRAFTSQGGQNQDALFAALRTFDSQIGTPGAGVALQRLHDILASQPAAAAKSFAANYSYINSYFAGAGLPTFANGGDLLVGGAGGTDSTLVQFMATPGEKVSISSAAQQRAGGVSGGRPVHVSLNITTQDANSFRRSEKQIAQKIVSNLSSALR